MEIKVQNLAQLFQNASLQYGDCPAFLTREGEHYTGPNFREMRENGEALASALLEIGVQAREHVALLADNRLEWMLAEYAIQFCGAVTVPRGTDISDQEMRYILSHSGAKYVFVENQQMFERLQKERKESQELSNISRVIVMDPDSYSSLNTEGDENVLSLYELIEKGKTLGEKGKRQVEERIAQIKAEDLFTLIYTSGTTGEPKGVMLTHANIISQVENLPVKITKNDRALSLLPVWHIFERLLEVLAIAKGAASYYTNIRTLREDIQLVRPTFMGSAPRLWENIYLGVMKKIGGGPKVAQALFRAASFCAKHHRGSLCFLRNQELDIEGRNPFVSLFLRVPFHFVRGLIFWLPYLLLDFIVLRKVRKATGGALRFSISGGGALPHHVDLFFNDIGILVLEGYGMTESPVLSVRRTSCPVIGTVGLPWPQTEIRLVKTETGEILYPNKRGEKGEVHVKGPQVMKGYYKREEATAKVLKDGWMNTGDLGIITYNNMLKLVGRSKETIVLLGGENVEPVPIENQLLQSPLIEHCMVAGQDQKFLSCLIVPSPEGLAEYGNDHASIAQSQDAYKLVQKEIRSIINTESGFKSFEKIVDCRLLPKPFVPGEELTNIFKLKRHVITEQYKDLIALMYS